MEEFATTVADLAQKLAEILAENLGRESSIFKDKCVASSCYLRMNRTMLVASSWSEMATGSPLTPILKHSSSTLVTCFRHGVMTCTRALSIE
ncbi:Gibberellin 2-beta-dioxygenase 8 [Linum grandiflorum]